MFYRTAGSFDITVQFYRDHSLNRVNCGKNRENAVLSREKLSYLAWLIDLLKLGDAILRRTTLDSLRWSL